MAKMVVAGDIKFWHLHCVHFKRAIDHPKHHLKIAKELGDITGAEKACGHFGNTLNRLGDVKTDIDHERCLNIAKELGVRSIEESLGDFKTARDYYDNRLKVMKETGDKAGERYVYGKIGDAHLSLGDVKNAMECYENQLKIANELSDKSGEGEANGNFGKVHFNLGNFKKAISYFERHLNVAKELGDKIGEGKANCNLGVSHLVLGDFERAIDHHRRHLKIVTELVDINEVGKAYANCGNIFNKLGYFNTAIDYHERHLNIAKKFGNKFEEASAYGNLGIAYHGLGYFKKAIDYQERCLNIAKDLGARWTEGAAYSNLGNVYESLGDFERARNYHESQLKIMKQLGDRSGEGKAYFSLGDVHQRMGDFKTAIDYLVHFLKIAKELGDKLGEGKVFVSLGNTHVLLGCFEIAQDYFKSALEIMKERGDRKGEGTVYCGLGNANDGLGHLKAALDYHKSHLEIAIEFDDLLAVRSAYGNLGITYLRLEDFKTALDFLERDIQIAIEFGDRSGIGTACSNLGDCYLGLGDLETAIQCHKRHLDIAIDLGEKFGQGIAYSKLGQCFQLQGQVPVAIPYYQQSIALFNSIRDQLQLNDELKISLRHRYQKTYAALWRLMLTEGNVTEALFSAEQGRAQGLKDLMELNYSFKRSDAYGGSGTGVKTVNELLRHLPPNTIFIAFGENELIFWVCQRGKEFELRKKQIHPENEVETFLKDLLQVVQKETGISGLVKCEDRSLESADSLVLKRSSQHGKRAQHLNLQRSALSTLYDTIIEPIQDLLLGTELMFVPEGPLCLAPFAAFKGPNSKYLCESFRIRVAPSLTSLKMIADCPVDYHHKSGALLVGDPLTERPPLPSAREEVEMIGRMLGITPLIGTQATKDEVLARLDSIALVHIAAHGNMETGEIALASTKGVKKNILTMRDVLGVQMRARLVVLSCCHSARGEIKAEGVVGIARAFLGAGARSVLVSLWAIDDEATLEFMKNFYQHLVTGKSASEALNQAMNCIRESEEFNAVKYWAPFVLIGDDVTLEFAGN